VRLLETSRPTASGPGHLEALASRAATELAEAPAEEVLGWAIDTFGDRLVITSSMAEAVLVDMAARIRPGVDVVFLDTGYHFAETLATRDAVAARYPVRLLSITPRQSVAEQDASVGPRLHDRDPDTCCALRKVAPLEQALAGYDAWATGLRRAETRQRRDVPVVGWDAARGKVKVSPLASWSQDQVDAYVVEHDVVVNPLVERGFPSIGCAPCTRRVTPGEDARAGRWAGTGKTECGLHTP
jgi:phosphoadenosine phosphosulfate reductase